MESTSVSVMQDTACNFKITYPTACPITKCSLMKSGCLEAYDGILSIMDMSPFSVMSALNTLEGSSEKVCIQCQNEFGTKATIDEIMFTQKSKCSSALSIVDGGLPTLSTFTFSEVENKAVV